MVLHLPELTYQCPADITDDYDERILKIPERITALNRLMHELESFIDAPSWNSTVSNLNACYVRGHEGELDEEETEKYRSPTYQARLLGAPAFVWYWCQILAIRLDTWIPTLSSFTGTVLKSTSHKSLMDTTQVRKGRFTCISFRRNQTRPLRSKQ